MNRMNLSLYTIKGFSILDSTTGARVLSKFYSASPSISHSATQPNPQLSITIPASNAPLANNHQLDLTQLKDQKTFERKLWEKTRKLLNNEIILFENHVVVYRAVVDVVYYVIGTLEDNEMMLNSILMTLVESINLVLMKYQTEKRTIIENMDLVALAIDECIDNGIVLETDPGLIASRVSKRASEMADISLGDPQSISNAFNKAKEQFLAGVLLS